MLTGGRVCVVHYKIQCKPQQWISILCMNWSSNCNFSWGNDFTIVIVIAIIIAVVLQQFVYSLARNSACWTGLVVMWPRSAIASLLESQLAAAGTKEIHSKFLLLPSYLFLWSLLLEISAWKKPTAWVKPTCFTVKLSQDIDYSVFFLWFP